jgi:hypothetical protein
MSELTELRNALWFVLVMGGLVVLFAAGVRCPLPTAGWTRTASRIGLAGGAAAMVVLANTALYRHDAHLDVTRSRAFTPSSEAQRVVRALDRDVELVYFFQKDSPAGRAMKTMVEILGRTSPRLHVRTVDPDRYPGLANKYGVRLYNVAVLQSGDRRIQVVTADDRDVALALLRLTRGEAKTICFATGHGEYDIDNFEFHTHFEGMHAHSHDVQGMAVVLTEQHGVGRLRRALERLGFAARKVTLATAGRVPADCAVLVDANPRTRYAPPESAALAEYLARGGRALLLYDLDFPVDPSLAEVLARAGIRVGSGAVVDPLDHYFTDEQMVAVARYAPHPVTRGLALSFYPGARPLEVLPPPAGVAVTVLFASSPDSYVSGIAGGTARARGPHPLAIAAEGVWAGGDAAAPFRLIVTGDADFASNSFFPYMSNSDLVLAMLTWLAGEERAPTMKPPIEVLPRVVLTNQQVRAVFTLTVIVLPGLVVTAGAVVWWRRRR